jgi:MoaA/NifB/PqqE/SkfB family radical SAM enzyme
MSYELAEELLDHLFNMGFNKMSFAGGEPSLWRYDVFKIMAYAKHKGAYTELITNGYKLQPQDLIERKHSFDILTIDIDSLQTDINFWLGKARTHVLKADSLFEEANRLDKICKVNTVVTSANINYVKDICEWIKKRPMIYRWKILQFLPSIGRAAENADKLSVTTQAFHEVCSEVCQVMEGWPGELIIEDNEYLSNGYASIDQQGYFYTSIEEGGTYKTKVIGRALDMNIEEFINHPLINKTRFIERSKNNCNNLRRILNR